MNLIEIAYPEGTLDESQRQAIATGITSRFLVEPDAPAQAIERAGRATHVWFHEGRTWTTGAGPHRGETPYPVVVTITVPEAWREELSRHAIGAVRAALLRHAPGVGLRDEGAVWINVVGVDEGSLGMNGKPVTSVDIVRYLTRDITLPEAEDLPEGVRIDPVCGMRVHLGKGTIRLNHNGQTIAFCATGCRNVYAQDHDISLAESA